MSPVDRARQALTGAGFQVYRPAEAIGPCTQPYLLVYDAGLTPVNRALGSRAVGVAAYVPLGRQAQLAPTLCAAQNALAAAGLRPRGSLQGEGVDETFRAHTQSIELTALCAL